MKCEQCDCEMVCPSCEDDRSAAMAIDAMNRALDKGGWGAAMARRFLDEQVFSSSMLTLPSKDGFIKWTLEE